MTQACRKTRAQDPTIIVVGYRAKTPLFFVEAGIFDKILGMSRRFILPAVMASAVFASACSQGGRDDAPESIVGEAVALDGDTIRIRDRTIDLWGVDAGSMSNVTGWFARAALDDMLDRDKKVSCVVRIRYRSRVQAICGSARSRDIGRGVIRNGWAVVSRGVIGDSEEDIRIGQSYARAETTARRLRLGQWSLSPVR